MTARQYELLQALAWQTKPVAPMMLGGRDASYHSAVCAQLVRKGWATRHGGVVWFRAAWKYRITPAGRRALDALAAGAKEAKP